MFWGQAGPEEYIGLKYHAEIPFYLENAVFANFEN